MKIGIIGCGNMGYAYAKSLIKSEIIDSKELYIFEKNVERAEFLVDAKLGLIFSTFSEALSECKYVILAVKPQSFEDVAKEIKPFINDNQVIISIMAGTRMDKISSLLSQKKVVRAMPNTPCQIGYGITGYFYEKVLSEKEETKVKTILESTGQAVAVSSEDLIDAVTAVSGSGPAYFFYILNSMIQSAQGLGISEENAKKLVFQTMRGAYHLAKNSPQTLDELIAAVKSKGGTTEAALNQFQDNDLNGIINKALNAANDRAKELSK